MKILCKCPSGKHVLKVAAKYAGRTVRCPECGEPIRVPKENAAPDNRTAKSSQDESSSEQTAESVQPLKKESTPPPPPEASPSKSKHGQRPAPLPRTERPAPQPAASSKPKPKPLPRTSSRPVSERPKPSQRPEPPPIELAAVEKKSPEPVPPPVERQMPSAATDSPGAAPPVDRKDKRSKKKKTSETSKADRTAASEKESKSSPRSKPQPQSARDVDLPAKSKSTTESSESPESKSKTEKKKKSKSKSEPRSADEIPKPRRRRRILQPSDGPKLMPPGTYLPERRRVATVRWFGAGLFLLIFIMLVPALWVTHLNLATGPDWARGAILLAVIQIFFVSWMMNMPDWTSLWVVMLVFAASATIYGAVTAMVVVTPGNQPAPLDLEIYRNMAKRWCAAMVLLNSLATYLCGYISVRWRRAVQATYATRTGSR